MKIAIFHELNKLSGARKVAIEYGKILSKNNTVDLFYVDEKENLEDINKFRKVYFFRFTLKKWKGNNWKRRIYKDSLELMQLYVLHKKISKIVEENKYDLIFINPSRFTQAPFLLRFLKKSIYFSQEPLRIVYDDLFAIPKDLNFAKEKYETLNRKIRKAIDYGNIKKAKLVLANSEYSKKNIKSAYNIDAVVCYLGADTNKFKNKNITKKYDLIFVGDKSNIEGYDLLTAALSLYKTKPTVLFVLRDSQGKGITEEKLINSFNMSKISLSLSRNEPFGLIPVEAMACGLPVIAVNEGGYKESVINNKTGYLINRKPEILKEKIDFLLKNNNIRENMGKEARKRVIEKFTWELSVKNFLQITNKYL